MQLRSKVLQGEDIIHGKAHEVSKGYESFIKNVFKLNHNYFIGYENVKVQETTISEVVSVNSEKLDFFQVMIHEVIYDLAIRIEGEHEMKVVNLKERDVKGVFQDVIVLEDGTSLDRKDVKEEDSFVGD